MVSPERSAQIDEEIVWEQLLELIEQEAVVPVVGQDLLVSSNGAKSFYSLLADGLAERLGVPTAGLPAAATLNAVACRFLDRGGGWQYIYPALKQVMSDFREWPIPAPLAQLARIDPFKLFITTTFDPLLQRALEEARPQAPKVLVYTPEKPDDIPLGWESQPAPLVYHLLGRVSAVPDFAVTEEDVLEFVHSLQSGRDRTQSLFAALNRKKLLILGCSFPDWLARFFIRIGKGDRLQLAKKTDYVADSIVSADRALMGFLQSFKTLTWVFERRSAVELVEELCTRWLSRRPTVPDPGIPERNGFIFLSYASEDRAAAEEIRSALEAAGLTVWFDRSELKSGDVWESRIRQAIDRCLLFLPVISRQTLGWEPRFFRYEWNQAIKQSLLLPDKARFIVPVAIDDTAEREETLPDKFREVQWKRLPAGEVSADFAGEMRKIFRSLQRRPS